MDKETEVVDHKETVITENDDNESGTPFVDLVKNQKPHEFGDMVGNALGDIARGSINDIKSDNYMEPELDDSQ